MVSKIKIKQYQQLQSKKFRQKYGLFVVEGYKSVKEVLLSQWPVEVILHTSDFDVAKITSRKVDIYSIELKDFMSISQQKNPQGILAIVKYHSQKITESPWQIAVDDINDPGNLGTIIRIADWYGINTIYCSENTVDHYNSKVIQSSMGSFLRLQVIRGDLAALLNGKEVFATVLNGESIRKLPETKQGVLLIGNEANGISDRLLRQIKHTPITIPGGDNTESLNAAMATAICCERLMG